MTTPQVLACSFRGDGYYALKLRQGVTDVRRCAWNDALNGIDIYDRDDRKRDITIACPRVFDLIFVGRVTAVPVVIEEIAA